MVTSDRRLPDLHRSGRGDPIESCGRSNRKPARSAPGTGRPATSTMRPGGAAREWVAPSTTTVEHTEDHHVVEHRLVPGRRRAGCLPSGAPRTPGGPLARPGGRPSRRPPVLAATSSSTGSGSSVRRPRGCSRRLSYGLEVHADGFDLDLAETARCARARASAMGKNSPFRRALRASAPSSWPAPTGRAGWPCGPTSRRSPSAT